MVFSPHNEISSLLPRLGGRIPPQDLGEEVKNTMIISTTAGHIDMIFNYRSSQSKSWCWKAAGLHLPPLQLGSTLSEDGNLVGEESVSWGKEFLLVFPLQP